MSGFFALVDERSIYPSWLKKMKEREVEVTHVVDSFLKCDVSIGCIQL